MFLKNSYQPHLPYHHFHHHDHVSRLCVGIYGCIHVSVRSCSCASFVHLVYMCRCIDLGVWMHFESTPTEHLQLRPSFERPLFRPVRSRVQTPRDVSGIVGV